MKLFNVVMEADPRPGSMAQGWMYGKVCLNSTSMTKQMVWQIKMQQQSMQFVSGTSCEVSRYRLIRFDIFRDQ